MPFDPSVILAGMQPYQPVSLSDIAFRNQQLQDMQQQRQMRQAETARFQAETARQNLATQRLQQRQSIIQKAIQDAGDNLYQTEDAIDPATKEPLVDKTGQPRKIVTGINHSVITQPLLAAGDIEGANDVIKNAADLRKNALEGITAQHQQDQAKADLVDQLIEKATASKVNQPMYTRAKNAIIGLGITDGSDIPDLITAPGAIDKLSSYSGTDAEPGPVKRLKYDSATMSKLQTEAATRAKEAAQTRQATAEAKAKEAELGSYPQTPDDAKKQILATFDNNPNHPSYHSYASQIDALGDRYTPKQGANFVGAAAKESEGLRAAMLKAREDKKVDPIISSQIGEIPEQNPGEDPAQFQQRLADWGKKAMDLKEKMAIDPAIARGVAYGMNRPVMVMDQNGIHYSTAGDAIKSGAAPATGSTATQAMSREAIVQDIRTSFEQLRDAAKKIDFTKWQRAKVAGVLANPATTVQNFISSAVANELTPDEQDYVIQVLNSREQVYGLRRALTGTGGGSDQQSAQILKTIPGANTPNFDFANKQIDTALGVLGRLEKGIPKVQPQSGGNNGRIRVRNKATGQTGTISEGAFDPAKYDKIP